MFLLLYHSLPHASVLRQIVHKYKSNPVHHSLVVPIRELTSKLLGFIFFYYSPLDSCKLFFIMRAFLDSVLRASGVWVLHPCFTSIQPYLRLMRLHQPVGIYLLLWPSLCGLAASYFVVQSPYILYPVFVLGAIVMRSVGCVINDIFDRRLDPKVARTKERPLASGELSIRQAVRLLFLLLALAAGLLLFLPPLAQKMALFIVIPIVLYPLMKRITFWPQIFLGLTFNYGILIGSAAAMDVLSPAAVALYLGSVFWTIGYDTVYAHQDKKDDAMVGIKSSALALGEHSKRAIGVFYKLAALFWICAGALAKMDWGFYIVWVFIAYQLFLQVEDVDLDDDTSCMNAFRSNVWLGLLLFIGFVIGRI